MTMILTDASADYDGSGSPITALGPVIVTLSGTKGNGPFHVTMMSRSDTANYTNTLSMNTYGRFKVNLANGDKYYFLAQIPSDASIDLSVVEA